jgi:hypothetical protein
VPEEMRPRNPLDKVHIDQLVWVQSNAMGKLFTAMYNGTYDTRTYSQATSMLQEGTD